MGTPAATNSSVTSPMTASVMDAVFTVGQNLRGPFMVILLPRQLLLDDSRECLQRLGSLKRTPVDEEGWRAVQCELRGLLDLFLHRRAMASR